MEKSLACSADPRYRAQHLEAVWKLPLLIVTYSCRNPDVWAQYSDAKNTTMKSCAMKWRSMVVSFILWTLTCASGSSSISGRRSRKLDCCLPNFLPKIAALVSDHWTLSKKSLTLTQIKVGDAERSKQAFIRIGLLFASITQYLLHSAYTYVYIRNKFHD